MLQRIDHYIGGKPMAGRSAVPSVVRVMTYEDAARLVNENAWGNGSVIFTRDGRG